MKHWFAIVAIVSLVAVGATDLHSQGCVAVRGGGMCSSTAGGAINLHKGEWNLFSSIRHFESFRHFRGDHEEAFRVQQGTEVINVSSFLDFGMTYGITERLFAGALLPFVHHDRSSLYEHGGNPRFDSTGALIGTWAGDRRHTYASGLADVRLSLGYWLFDPAESEYNYSVALGVKLATGAKGATGTFYNQGPNRDQIATAVVDQSIQPGDGGIGYTFEMQGMHPITHELSVASNLFYMANVTNTNGVRQRTAQPTWAPDSAEYSSPDQYAARLGLFYNSMDGWSGYVGGRVEGLPSTDLIGGSEGWRRPGYAVSVEPGFGYATKDFSVFASVPIALYRNRVQNYIDKIRTAQRGVEVIGDAAFADYLINISFSYRFGGSQHEM